MSQTSGKKPQISRKKMAYFNQMMVTMATMFKMNFHYLNNVCGVMSQKHTHFYKIL